MELSLQEQMLKAWVGMTCMIKNNRMTEELTYNEAIVMMFAYDRYCEDGVGRISIGELIAKTNMLKSLINRTVGALEKRGYVVKSRGEQDGRTVYIQIVGDRIGDFMRVHDRSLCIADELLALIGTEDAAAFVRSYSKISAAAGSWQTNSGAERRTGA